MSETKSIGKIYASIIKVMNAVSPVAKNGDNEKQNFKYKKLDDIMNALHGILAMHGVFIVPEVLETTRTERPTKFGGLVTVTLAKVKFTFFADDGSFIQATTNGEAMDPGDKSTSKALSIAFKYACMEVFCIPTDDVDKDPDNSGEDLSAGKAKDAQPKQPKKAEPEVTPEKPEIPPEKVFTDAQKLKMSALMQTVHANGTRVFTKEEYHAYLNEFSNTPIAVKDLLDKIDAEYRSRISTDDIPEDIF
jgi:hypothetical protein